MERNIFSDGLELFVSVFYPRNEEPLACRLHSAFQQGEDDHNCLGCNFEQATRWIFMQLGLCQVANEKIADLMPSYLLSLYLFVERAFEIFEIINLPEEYRRRHFEAFRDIHKWANFIKHPKAFLTVHHPVYFFEGDPEYKKTDFNITIDQAFVNKYYSGAKKNHELYSTLKNQTGVAILFPHPTELMRRFCEAGEAFFGVLRDNPVYREVLASRTTYEDYYAEADESATEKEGK